MPVAVDKANPFPLCFFSSEGFGKANSGKKRKKPKPFPKSKGKKNRRGKSLKKLFYLSQF
jgi:hypothetical protein